MLDKTKKYRISDDDGNCLVIGWHARLGRWTPYTGYLGGFMASYDVRFSEDILIRSIEAGDIKAEEA